MNTAGTISKTKSARRLLFVVMTLAGLATLLAGCAVGPDYKRPAVDATPMFRGESSGATNSFGDLTWWEVFPDARLQELIRQALTNNYDLRIAVARVEAARASAAATRAQFFPQLGYNASVGHGHDVSAGGGPAPAGSGSSGTLYLGEVTAAWEIDLFGRIRRLNESARAELLATEEARRYVRISLISQVAEEYFNLLALDEQLEIARRTTNSFGESLRIFEARLRGGVASKIETSSAAASQAAAAAVIPRLEQQIAASENQLSLLVGTPPQSIHRGKVSFQEQSIPTVPAGLPSRLLERRPDLRRAEAELRSANAQVGVAVADYFPQLNLTGLLGRASPELSAITSGGDVAWSVAAGLTGPIFHGGEIRARHKQALAVREQASLQYRAAVLASLREVSDALIARDKLGQAQIDQERAVAAYRAAESIARQRYQVGKSSYYEVLQEQQLLFPAENTLVDLRLNQLLSIVRLYLALGGGWQDTPTSQP